jgi:hypothetical protein
MLLKREYDLDSKGNPTTVNHIKVLHAGPKQRFSTGLVASAIAAGWMTLGQGKIKLHTKPELTYKVVRVPGLYCCHCRAPMVDSETAKLHVASAHKGRESPDPTNPSGYEHIHYYDCVKE